MSFGYYWTCSVSARWLSTTWSKFLENLLQIVENMLKLTRAPISSTPSLFVCICHSPDLSFQGQAPLKVDESVQSILSTLGRLSEKQNGIFVDWEGNVLPWWDTHQSASLNGLQEQTFGKLYASFEYWHSVANSCMQLWWAATVLWFCFGSSFPRTSKLSYALLQSSTVVPCLFSISNLTTILSMFIESIRLYSKC